MKKKAAGATPTQVLAAQAAAKVKVEEAQVKKAEAKNELFKAAEGAARAAKIKEFLTANKELGEAVLAFNRLGGVL